MRIRAVVAFVITVLLASAGPVLSADEGSESDCMSACDAAFDACQKAADADVERCREDAFEPCDDWCPCDQFIGAAHFACILECERCKLDAEDDADRCPDGSAAKAECASVQRRCMQKCASDE